MTAVYGRLGPPASFRSKYEHKRSVAMVNRQFQSGQQSMVPRYYTRTVTALRPSPNFVFRTQQEKHALVAIVLDRKLESQTNPFLILSGTEKESSRIHVQQTGTHWQPSCTPSASKLRLAFGTRRLCQRQANVSLSSSGGCGRILVKAMSVRGQLGKPRLTKLGAICSNRTCTRFQDASRKMPSKR